jgi:hypothetical protein
MRKCLHALTLCLLEGAVAPAWAQWTPRNPVVSVQPRADGIVLALQSGFLKL